MSVNINLSAKKDLSLASLRRRYPTIESILVEASLVSLYRYKKKLDGTKYWVKENVTGPLFIVQHESKNDTVDHCVVVLNQEGRNDFSLAINSISIIIPQEEFLMLRYLNQDMNTSTMAIWCQDYKQRDGVINSIFSSMGLRVGNVVPCNPYKDHKITQSVSATHTPSKLSDKVEARTKLLSIIRQPRDSDDDFTDTGISGKRRIASQTTATPDKAANGFSNKIGLDLLAKLKTPSPSKSETKVTFSPEHRISSPPKASHSPSKAVVSVSPINVNSSRESNNSESFSDRLPPAMIPPETMSQSILQSQYHHVPIPPFVQYSPNYMPYPSQQPVMHPAHPVLISAETYAHIPPQLYTHPLHGSHYDPTPRNPYHAHPTHAHGHAMHNLHGASHGYSLPAEGAASYLLTRFGKPNGEPGR